MTRQQPEAKIVNAILKALNALPQTYVRKTHGNRFSSGWPDIVGVHRGVPICLEAKTATGKASARQLHELGKWEQAGAVVGIVRSVDEAMAVIEIIPPMTQALA